MAQYFSLPVYYAPCNNTLSTLLKRAKSAVNYSGIFEPVLSLFKQ
ncbi:hypothetical protein AC062_0333 [Pasteurellaceae bacterium NI1060]|nr:hypothetical protein AC062_0333 [Pasteurellaceae bacterium NI1060]